MSSARKSHAVITAARCLAAASVMAMASVTAQAEVLLIEGVEMSQQRDLPDNGLSKAQVESRYGAPARKHAAVGQPPISRWDYAEYSVYFEFDTVITSVLEFEPADGGA